MDTIDLYIEAVPDSLRPRRLILKTSFTALSIPIIPSVECGAGIPSLIQVGQADRLPSSTCRMIAGFSDEGYLIRGLPNPKHAFLKRRRSSVWSATTPLRSFASRRSSLNSTVFAARSVPPESNFFPTPMASLDHLYWIPCDTHSRRHRSATQ